MKRIFSFVTALVLLFVLIPAGTLPLHARAANWYDKVWIQGDDYTEYYTPWYYYTVKNGEVTIGPLRFPDETVIEFPATLRGYPVTRITGFEGSEITGAVLPDSVLSLDAGTFKGCTKLQTVTIGTGLQELPADVFRGCTALTTVNYNAAACSVQEVVNGYTGTLFSECKALKTINVGSSVKTIPNDFLAKNTSLTAFKTGENVAVIGEYAFAKCTSLKTVTLTNSVKSIDCSAFEGCTALEDVTLSSNLQSIGEAAFYDCAALEDLTIPDTVYQIGRSAFNGTAYLENNATWENNLLYVGKHLITSSLGAATKHCTIKEGTLTISGDAFHGHESLQTVTIPDSVRGIGEQAFWNCPNLTSIHIPNTVVYIGDQVLNHTAYYENDDNWENGALYVGKHLIAINRNMQGSYSVKEGTHTVAGGAFRECTALTAVTIPNGVPVIPAHTFDGCTALTTVTIPATVQRVMTYAFSGCDALTTVYYRGTAATRADILINDNNEPLTEATWEYIGGGHAYTNQNDNICNICGEDKTLPYYTYTVTDGKATVTDVKVAITGDVVIPETLGGAPVTALAKDAFRDCVNVTSVTIPAAVTAIGTSAFKGCTALKTVYYNAVDCATAGSSAYPVFSGCASLDTVHIGDGVTRIPAQLFRGLAALKTVFLAKSVTTIEKNAFYQDTALSLVRYGGTSADRKGISVASYNTALTNAKWVYTACEHTYDNACDKDCNICGKERKAERHVWDDGVVLEDATATKTGSKQFTCTVCGSTAVVETTLGTVEDGVYYYDGVQTANAGLVMVDGAYYYVAAGGKVKTGRYAISNVNGTDVERGIYYFFEDGTMNTDEGVYDGYYYQDGGKSKAYAGLIEWSGSKYYVSDGGRVKTGRYFISKLNGIVPKKRAYTFYNDGSMLEETRIYEADGYYYEDGIRIPYAGLVEYEGHFYYVADNGAYVTSKRQNVSNTGYTEKSKGYYYFDENGYMLTHTIVDGRYYGKDGLAPYNAGVVKVGSYYYYVGGTHGLLKVNQTFSISAAKANGLLTAGKYTADANGRLTAA